jgi:hypothetical protein
MTLKIAVQDGADFFDDDTQEQIARIVQPFLNRTNPDLPGDHWYSLEAAEEARTQFLVEHPDYTFAVDAEE